MPGHSPEAPHLEFEGATLPVGEEIAAAMADELDGVDARSETTEVHAIARELRLWVFMASVCDASNREERDGLIERLERLGARVHELVDEPVDEWEEQTVVRKSDQPAASLEALLLASSPDGDEGLSPRYAMRIVDIHGEDGHGFDDEMTDVKRAKWERNTNRALSPVPGAPSPSSRPPSSLASLGAFLITNRVDGVQPAGRSPGRSDEGAPTSEAGWHESNEETPPV